MFGAGYKNSFLNRTQILEICHNAFDAWKLDGKKVLFIIPDNTRTAPIDRIFKIAYELLSDRVSALDYLVALGTHPPMRIEEILRRVGISAREWEEEYSKTRFFNHLWNNPRQLLRIGKIDEKEVEDLSQGLMRQSVEVQINRLIFEYDVLIIAGPVFPHEVVGFSGGNKYLFPGIAGQKIIDMFHWLGALITSPVIIGKKSTPVRDVINRASEFVKIDTWNLSLVVKNGELAGLFAGKPDEAWAKAADLSGNLHVVYKERTFKKVLSCAPEMYDDLWVGAKCMYKLEPVVEDNGELIIYAPHIREISHSHGKLIAEIGYHVRDYFVQQWEKFRKYPAGVLAHSTHVRGVGNFSDGEEKPRIKVTLATGIPESVCQRINLGYRDPESIKVEDWMGREEEGILFVPGAGEILFRLKKDPFREGFSDSTPAINTVENNRE